jgi:hypothetical protein
MPLCFFVEKYPLFHQQGAMGKVPLHLVDEREDACTGTLAYALRIRNE